MQVEEALKIADDKSEIDNPKDWKSYGKAVKLFDCLEAVTVLAAAYREAQERIEELEGDGVWLSISQLKEEQDHLKKLEASNRKMREALEDICLWLKETKIGVPTKLKLALTPSDDKEAERK